MEKEVETFKVPEQVLATLNLCKFPLKSNLTDLIFTAFAEFSTVQEIL